MLAGGGGGGRKEDFTFGDGDGDRNCGNCGINAQSNCEDATSPLIMSLHLSEGSVDVDMWSNLRPGTDGLFTVPVFILAAHKPILPYPFTTPQLSTDNTS